MTDHDTQFTGKYENTGKIGRKLIDRFYRSVIEMLDPPTAGKQLLEVGCGAGYSTHLLNAACSSEQTLTACDIGQTLIKAAQQRNPDIDFFQASAYALPLPDKSVDSILMLEVLEHLEHPQQALAELSRVARKRVVISTPREPLWCALNFARGKYLRHIGNTPGHIQHWSSRGLKREAEQKLSVTAMRTPLPWTILRLIPR